MNLHQTLTDTWQNEVRRQFSEGLIAYERQLQAIWYRALKDQLDPTYEVWVEPSVYLSEDLDNSRARNLAKPDLVITHLKEIVAVIELKCNPWGYPSFAGDLQKLVDIHNRDGYPNHIELGWKPVSPIWANQYATKDATRGFDFANNTLFVFASVAHPNTGASQSGQVQSEFDSMPKSPERISNFWHFRGVVHLDGEIDFTTSELISKHI